MKRLVAALGLLLALSACVNHRVECLRDGGLVIEGESGSMVACDLTWDDQP